MTRKQYMFSPTERLIARRYLKPRKGEGFLSIVAGFSLIGIALGVATLIVVMSVMDGFRAELMGKILSVNGHVQVKSYAGPLTEVDPLVDKLSQFDNVKSVIPHIQGQGLVLKDGRASGVIVRGLSKDDLLARPAYSNNLSEQSLANFAGRDKILVGARLAENYGLLEGDQFTILAPSFNTTAFGQLPRYKTFTIAGTFELGMYEYDSSLVLMPLEAARPFFNLPDNAIDALEIDTQNPEHIDAVIRQIQETLPHLAVSDWRRQNRSFFNAVQVERNVMFIILTLIILVAAFNIISSLVMLVKNKSSDIAILRTMGATAKQIRQVFLFAGLLIGGSGVILGLILGISFAYNIEAVRQVIEKLTGAHLFPGDVYFLSKLPVDIDFVNIGMVASFALLISVLAALYPAWRAGKLNPVEILRSGE